MKRRLVFTAFLVAAFCHAAGFPKISTLQTRFWDSSGNEIADPVSTSDDYYGEDAHFSVIAPSYTVSTSGLTVLDNNTGLTWAKTPGATGLSHDGAVAYIASLNSQKFAGYSDWRLPTYNELLSISEFAGESGPYIDTTVFDGASNGPNWSAVGSISFDFSAGQSTATAESVVRAVRGSAYGFSSTLTDPASIEAMDWKSALAFVQQRNTSNYLGFNDWRLPNVREVLSAPQDGMTYWSSTTDAGAHNRAYVIANGVVSSAVKTDMRLVRIVRDASTDGVRYLQKVFDGVSVTSDIPYGSATTYAGATKTLALDIYAPSNDTVTARPLVVLVPGGGFSSQTDKSSLAAYATLLAEYGYIVATINYRTFDGRGLMSNSIIKTLIVQGLQDSKSAIQFLRDNAATYQIDPARVFLGGHSAGAMVAGHAVYLDDAAKADSEFQTAINAAGGLGSSANVLAWVDLAGSLVDKAYIGGSSVPMIGVYGTSDAIMPLNDGGLVLGPPDGSGLGVSGSVTLFAQALYTGSSASLLYTIEGGDHFAPADATQTASVARVAAFLYGLL